MKQPKTPTKHYLLTVWKSIEPSVKLFKSEEERDRAAGVYQLKENSSDESGVFRLDVSGNGKVNVYSYTGGEMDALVEEAEINLPTKKKGRK